MVVHTTYENPWPGAAAISASQLHLDFWVDGQRIGHTVIVAMFGCAFILWIRVLPAYVGRGYGRQIHLELIRRYGSVACETFCSEDEWRCLRSLRLRGEVDEILEVVGPMVTGQPAIYRHGKAVERMFVCRRNSGVTVEESYNG